MLEGLNETEKKQITELLRESGSQEKETALAAQKALAAQLTAPLRKGVLSGSTIAGIFTPQEFDPAARIEYPIDFYRSDNASEFVAYVIPNQGKIPERHVEGDYITVPTYDIGNSIDFLLRYAREARWDIVSRALEVLEAGFDQKISNDGWHTLLKAGFDRNIIVGDANASAGQLTKRIISLMKLVMRRNAGGNSASKDRGRLTDLFVSPEALEDIRNWGVDEVDEITRREIFLAGDEAMNRIYNVNITALDELGEGQEYQDYYVNVIAAGAANDGMASGDVELVIGLDLSKNDSFVMPIREQLQVFEDESLHRSRRMSFYAWASLGVAALDGRRVILGSI